MNVIPLIKEHRKDKIILALNCFYTYPFNRILQKECILKIYNNKTEKSVFRGMIIPSLRIMGLIVGKDKEIRLSSNGMLIVESPQKILQERSYNAIIIELDNSKFNFLNILIKNKNMRYEDLHKELINSNLGNEYNLDERIKSWLEMLEEINIISKDNNEISFNIEKYSSIKKDLDIEIKKDHFIKILMDSFIKIKNKEKYEMIDITELRKEVAMIYLNNYSMVLTENQFDLLLRKIPKITNSYIITFGQPIGSEEKLFEFKGNFYRTINIKNIGGGYSDE
ncbi:MAG: hypothetical protein Q8N88_01520 [Nanoarchaeota archaeon]|nr:hypothetical protein [Nanoarchaeota archaeon]